MQPSRGRQYFVRTLYSGRLMGDPIVGIDTQPTIKKLVPERAHTSAIMLQSSLSIVLALNLI